MHRETIELTIADHTFKVKTFANAMEMNLIQQAYFKGSKVTIVGQEPQFSEFNPNVQFEVKVEMVRQLVVEMDGTSDKIVERLTEGDIPVSLFEDLATQIDALITKKKS